MLLNCVGDIFTGCQFLIELLLQYPLLTDALEFLPHFYGLYKKLLLYELLKFMSKNHRAFFHRTIYDILLLQILVLLRY